MRWIKKNLPQKSETLQQAGGGSDKGCISAGGNGNDKRRTGTGTY